ncbi:hypothetical protein WA538_002816, partial [Blastocystis sp. DL]
MMTGVKLNITEGRAVLHTALRANRDETIYVDGKNVVPEVYEVRERIKEFSERVRSGAFTGCTGKTLNTVISIGIGGSYLGPQFVYEALRFDPMGHKTSEGRELHFVANVDPLDMGREIEHLDPERTLVVIVSKTFTTAETMLNARSLRRWLLEHLSDKSSESEIIAHHMCAVSSNIAAATAFGIDKENIFGFWDWVGGRYSVCSAVGLLPLSLHYGYEVMEQFLAGAHDIDVYTRSAPVEQNIAMMLGLIGVWNSSFLNYPCRALLPYSQALLRFPAHIQQVDMESNGKRVTMDGTAVPFDVGEVDFGEPGTNGQHSFYQLIHQGRVIPCDFIGFCTSQYPLFGEGETVSNHDELMSNFFAQPDALAYGKNYEDLAAQGVPENLKEHKFFSGNRPSSSLLFKELNAYSCGQLLSIYEHRTAVQGFVWGICSFDQWGVELGKVLATSVRKQMHATRSAQAEVQG